MTLLQRRQDQLITGEELSRMPDLGPCELVEGSISPRESMSSGFWTREGERSSPTAP